MRSPAFEEWLEEEEGPLKDGYSASQTYDDETGGYHLWSDSRVELAWRAWCAALGFVAKRNDN